MRSYKDNLSYDPKWKRQYPWVEYNSSSKGMVCSVCTSFGKVPVQAKGAWVTRPVCNWVKATSLLAKHGKSDWHKAALEKGLITLQIENGDIKLRNHRDNSPRNATYESYATVVDLLSSISKVMERDLLSSFNSSAYFSLMADESTDVSSKEELSICVRWEQGGKPVEHFLGIMPAKETTAQAIATYLCDFLEFKSIDITKIRGIGFDGTNTMSGQRSGVQKRLRLFRRLMHLHHKKSSLQQVLSALLSSTTIATSFPNLAKLAAILIVLPVTTATVERTFSSMKLIKTRLRNRMGESTLEHTMIICIEGPDRLSN